MSTYREETSAGGIVYKRQENSVYWLITQHSLHKGWGFPKGIIGDTNPDEPQQEAALREVEEEGGVKAKILHNDPTEIEYSYRQGNVLVKKKVYYFLMEYVSGDPENHDWEVEEAKFVKEDEVLETLTYKEDKSAFGEILKIYAAITT